MKKCMSTNIIITNTMKMNAIAAADTMNIMAAAADIRSVAAARLTLRRKTTMRRRTFTSPSAA